MADPKTGGAIMRVEMTYLERITAPQVKLELWAGVGPGMKAAKPAEYPKTLEAWLSSAEKLLR